MDYYKGGTGEIETRVQEATMGIEFENERQRELHDQRTRSIGFSRPIRIQGIPLPAGDYDYLDYSLSCEHQQQQEDQRQRLGELGRVLGRHAPIVRRRAERQARLPPERVTHLHAQQPGTVERHVEYPLVRHAGRLRLQPAVVLQRVPPIQQRDARSQHEHPLQHHVQAAERIYIVYNDRRDTTNEPIERAFIVKVTRLLTF